MQKIRYGFVVLWIALCSVTSASAQVSIGIGLPNVSIGINLPLFPELVPVPGYPVYYAPRVDANYFFYDGMYWVYQDDNWYASSWYNGPWGLVEPEVVPLFILRIPVRYYRQPPVYFRGWQSNAPPRWGQHWGHDGSSIEADGTGGIAALFRRAPRCLSTSGSIRETGIPTGWSSSRRCAASITVTSRVTGRVRQHFQQQVEQRAPAPAQRGRQEEPRMRAPGQQDIQRQAPQPQSKEQRFKESERPKQQGGPSGSRSQPQQPKGVQHERQAPQPQSKEQRFKGSENRRSLGARGTGKERKSGAGNTIINRFSYVCWNNIAEKSGMAADYKQWARKAGSEMILPFLFHISTNTLRVIRYRQITDSEGELTTSRPHHVQQEHLPHHKPPSALNLDLRGDQFPPEPPIAHEVPIKGTQATPHVQNRVMPGESGISILFSQGRQER